jgi:hypothetical protein
MRATRARARVVRGDGDGASRARVVVGRRAVEGDEGDDDDARRRRDG